MSKKDIGLANESRDWLVVNTHAHRESIAIEHLDRQGFRTYCPFYRRRLRQRRRYLDVLRPLFSGYVFVQQCSETARLRSVMSTYGVRHVVKFGDEFATVSDAFVESLVAREVDGAVSQPMAALKVGDQIVLAGGPFDGLIGQILSLSEKDRLIVLMNLLNQPTKVRVDRRHVGPVIAQCSPGEIS